MVVVPSTVDTLNQYASEVLAVAETSLATTDEGTPTRSYLTSATNFSWDCCPFLTVFVGRLAEAPTAPLAPTEATARRGDFGNIILATYVITVARCAPQIQNDGFPLVADIAAIAAQTEQDGWALWNGLRHAHANGEIFDGCLGVHFDGGVPIREQGACVGWEFTIRASIPGIPNT